MQSPNSLVNNGPHSNDPARSAFAIIASDTVLIPGDGTRSIMVTVTGDITATFLDDSKPITIVALQPGVVYPFAIKQLWTTTTASGVIGLR